jgi:ribonuclease D
VATDQRTALIDPLAGLDDRPFWRLIADPALEKIVHAGIEDVGLCVQRTGELPRNVFDLQIAAGMIGLDYPLSLLKLARATVGARLHKSQTLTDWRQRPLTEAQLHYAREDVAHLPGAHRFIVKRLTKLGRMDWAREEFERFERPETYRRGEEEALLRLKGARTLSPRGLAIARELMKVREALAERFNRPPRVFLKDHLLVEIARHEWTTVNEIRGLRGVQLATGAVRDLAEAAQRGLNSPPESWPRQEPLDMDTPQEGNLMALVTAVIGVWCYEHELAYGLVCSKQTIRELVRTFTREDAADDGPLSRGWRSRTIGKLLHEFFAGKKRLGIARQEKGFELVIK